MPVSVTSAPTGASRGARPVIETGGWFWVRNVLVKVVASALPSTSRRDGVSWIS